VVVGIAVALLLTKGADKPRRDTERALFSVVIKLLVGLRRAVAVKPHRRGFQRLLYALSLLVAGLVAFGTAFGEFSDLFAQDALGIPFAFFQGFDHFLLFAQFTAQRR
jgi:hypothetical protein